MTFNGISRISDDLGDYILLRDYGSEGLSVGGQYAGLREALKDACSTDAGTSWAIVKLVRVDVNEKP